MHVPSLAITHSAKFLFRPGVTRVIVTARQTLAPDFKRILQRLVGILGIVSKNPSNPNFDQYIFESISALIRYGIYACQICSFVTFVDQVHNE